MAININHNEYIFNYIIILVSFNWNYIIIIIRIDYILYMEQHNSYYNKILKF